MSLPLEDRYAFANHVLRAAAMVMIEGLGEQPDKAEGYILHHLQQAAGRLGYDVTFTQKPPTVYRFDLFVGPSDSDE